MDIMTKLIAIVICLTDKLRIKKEIAESVIEITKKGF